MRLSVHMIGLWALVLFLCLAGPPVHAGHLHDEASSSGPTRVLAQSQSHSTALRGAHAEQQIERSGSRRNGGPPPTARFLRANSCGAACMPPGQLMDFSGGGGTGPPGALPSAPEPPLVVAPLPQSAVLLLAGLGLLAVLGRNRRRGFRA